jgi:CBS domain-containing protein
MSHSETQATEVEGSYRVPRFEHARVSDVMRAGALTCRPEAPLRDVARTMAGHHIHCVVVGEPGAPRSWKLLSDLDLVAAIRSGGFAELTAGDVANGEMLTVTRDDALEHAARLMTEHRTSHLAVVDDDAQPVGMLSTLDVAGCVAWGLA